jgi:serine/threonine protein kinase
VDRGQTDHDSQNRPVVGCQFADRYEIISEIGQGGICNVYLAHEAILDRHVALKVLKPALSSDPVQNQRFRNEARATSALCHPNIVAILSYGASADGLPFIAMEYLDGRTLEIVFKEEGKTDKDRFARIFLPILSALVYAHSCNIVHRDLKPANIMVLASPEGEQVKLLDFSIAKILEQENSDSQLTDAGLTGTPYYMSPEQCAGGRIDRRSDIYSLACVMYEALAGKPPFACETTFATMYGHVNESISRLEKISASLEIPQSLVRAIMKALAKDPADRQQSMAKFENEIAGALSAKAEATAAARSKKFVALAGALALSVILIILACRHKINLAHTDSPSKTSLSQLETHRSPVTGIKALFSEIDRLKAIPDYAGAEKCARELIKICESRHSQTPEDLFNAHLQLGGLYHSMGRYGDAEKEFRLAANLYPIPWAQFRLSAMNSLCTSLYMDGRHEEAFKEFRRFLKEAGDTASSNVSPELAADYGSFAHFLNADGQKEEALENAGKSLTLLARFPGYHCCEPMVSNSWLYYRLGTGLGQTAEAKKALRNCRDWLKRPDQDPVPEYAYQYAREAFLSGLWQEADDMCRFALKESARVRKERADRVKTDCLALLAELKGKTKTGK